MAECCIPDFHGDHYDDIDHSIWYFEVGGLRRRFFACTGFVIVCNDDNAYKF